MLNQDKKERIKNKIFELALISTSHGLPSVFRAEKISIKVMWFILFCISTSFAIYLSIKSILSYLDFDVVSKIDILNDIPAEFPSITFYSYLKKTSSLRDVILNCTFNLKTCNENDIETLISGNGSIIYIFKSRKTYFSGSLYGLNLLIKPDSLADIYKIIIHSRNSNPRIYDGSSIEGINVSPGYATNIGINRVLNSKLGEPYNKCLKDVSSIDSFDSELFKYILTSTNYSYTQKDCFDYCLGRKFYEYLNVTNKIDHWINVFINSKSKISESDLLNIYFKLVDNKAILDNCFGECPLECDSTTYETSMYFNELIPTSEIIWLNIYYNDLIYTYISQVPKMEIVDVISNFGGILGLFIGISFLSFAELLELFIEIIFICFQNSSITIELNK